MAKIKHQINHLDDLPAIMKVLDVQEVMGLSKVTAYELVNSKGFPVLKVGKRLTIPKEAFLKWLNENLGKHVKGKRRLIIAKNEDD